MHRTERWLYLASLATAIFVLTGESNTRAADSDDHMLAHNVFFSLKDNAPPSIKKWIESCKKHLTGQPGVFFFAVGTRAGEEGSPALDRDYDVSLHIVFRDRAAHDRYMKSDRRKDFVLANRAGWSKVRLFISLVEK